MLTKADDYPIHQTPEPIAYAGGHRNFYDRYFFNGYSSDGALFFAAALGVYPTLNIMDAAFCVVHDGRQYNLRASRALRMERLDTRVGPIEIEVIEPLRVLRVVANDPDHGFSADIQFNARVDAIEEPRFTRHAGTQVVMDVTRLTQNGDYRGTITLKNERFELDRLGVQGTRDRSWGVRPVGARDPQPNPSAGAPQFYWLWAPCNFPSCGAFYHVNSDAEGKPWNTRGVIAPKLGAGRSAEIDDVSSTLSFKSGTRHAAHAIVNYVSPHHGNYKIELEPQYHFYMKGLGYGHPEWGHGSYHGESAAVFDEYVLADAAPTDPTNIHIQAICKATLTSDAGTERGIGVLEQLIIGAHKPSGFKELLDMAP